MTKVKHQANRTKEHERNKEKQREKQTLCGNSKDKREKERIYNQYRITDNNNATGRRNHKINWVTENYQQIPRRKQKRGKIPAKNSGKSQIRKKTNRKRRF